MTLLPGQRLGPYEILSPLGAGGMGEVYKARDVRLDRAVAIKVLPVEFASDAARLRRFELEARAASALNHPNIVTVYDIGTEGPTSYIAMEFVDGRTLRDVLLTGTLPLKRLLDLATQIADGIAAAHEAGIVHRDLKPGNLMVTRDGFVKVLDFGLARREPHLAEETQHPESTVTSPPTMPGAVLGTVGYMSPEQVRGENSDYRADQFSFGSILYEMATGVRAFRRPTAVEVLSAILNEDPEPISRLRPGFPPPLRWIIERCLAKSPGERYRATSDLARELEGIREHLSEISGEVSLPRPRSSRRRTMFVLAASVAAISAAVIWLGLSAAAGRPNAAFFRRLTFRDGYVMRALFVPRSNGILYTATWDGGPVGSYLTLPEAKGVDRRIDAPVQLPMAYTEDGSEVLVLLGGSRAMINPLGVLAWWPALGGKPRPILDGAGWADWARRGHFLAVVRTSGDERVLETRDAAGRFLKTLFRTSGAVSWVRISPDEHRVAFIHHRSRFDDSGEVRVADVDGSGGRAISSLFERCRGLAWNRANGEVWFTATEGTVDSTALWAASRSGRSRRLYGFSDLLLLQDVSEKECLLTGEAGDTRLFVHREGASPVELSWLGSSFVSDISHDGKSVLFIDGTSEDGTLGTWIRPIDGGEATRVADGEPAAFSPDDQTVVTTTHERSRPSQIVLVSLANGSSRPLTRSAESNSSPSFLGSDSILFCRTEAGRNSIWRLRIADGAESRLASGCDRPSADVRGSSFLCVGGPNGNALLVGSVTASAQPAAVLRSVYELSPGPWFLCARWDGTGRVIHAVTSDRRVVAFDASTGAILRDSPISLPESIRPYSILGAALLADASAQAYSVSHLASHLYLFRGL